MKKTVGLLLALCFMCLALNEALNRFPTPARLYPTRGTASWYIPHQTATGEKYDRDNYTCAMRRRDFGKYYVVCNQENGKCVTVRQNDWGPYWVLFNQGRIIDLSREAFAKISPLGKGLASITLIPIED